ncbi:protein LTV1 homolog isoform X2 [Saccoglossus kowalevskii]|uniref:Protein LTV1 homolog n=1 Tax=Saccoglossus kowalevskii TaxID=10224 RepID=A0ABM0MRK8_SACKO|nr:PREDICTED: protein LTV1 homolog isoform X2 [Saccoglossus kowalevskii]
MPGKKTKFIDKKKAITFQVVHRSQKDPLQADDESSQHVLRPLEEEKRKEDQRSFGVYYDDEYNYMQHLKDPKAENELVQISQPAKKDEKEPKIKLPASVFASDTEEKTGMLNKAAPISGPQLDLDPDVVAAMDDDFNFDDPDNELDDDFVVKASGPLTDAAPKFRRLAKIEDLQDELRIGDSSDDYPSDGADADDSDQDDDKTFSEIETKSHFTNYSMTSSVMRRNEGLTLLDDRFEKLYEEYEDDEIGALDHEELAGRIQPDSDILNAVLGEFEKHQKQSKVTDITEDMPGRRQSAETRDNISINENDEDRKGLPSLKSDIIDIDYGDDYSTSSSEDELVSMVTEEPKEEWDCETILSTYSNIYNRPTVIEEPCKGKAKEIKLSEKTGIPKDVLPKSGPTKKQIEREELESERIVPKGAPPRVKGESPEERRSRKHQVKEQRRERRIEKKANQEAFKEEEKRQEKVMISLNQNLQGIKLS